MEDARHPTLMPVDVEDGGRPPGRIAPGCLDPGGAGVAACDGLTATAR